MKTWIPYAKQDIDQSDIEAVVKILTSPNLTQGPTVERFEEAVAKYCGAKYAVAVNSATSGLHIACLAAGLGPGDEHWTVPNTFVASANCGLYCGSKVDFVDIDPKTYNMGVGALREKLQRASTKGKLPKVLIPVHFSGQSAEMEEISKLARQYGITVIEDASHAIGGSYQGRKIGSGQYSDMTVFSFHPVKIITTGEGGMVVTNDEKLYEKLKRLRSHGITRDERFLTQLPADGHWSYEQLELGYNYRLTDLHSALGISQMKRIDPFVERRHKLANAYFEKMRDLPIQLPTVVPDAYSAWHLYVVRVPFEKLGIKKTELYEGLRKRNVGSNVHYIPVHLQPYYRKLGFERGQFPEAENYYEETLSIPMYYQLSDEEQNYVVEQWRDMLSR